MSGNYDQRKRVFRDNVKDTINPTGTCGTVIFRTLATISLNSLNPVQAKDTVSFKRDIKASTYALTSSSLVLSHTANEKQMRYVRSCN